jgi:hypothetical protein
MLWMSVREDESSVPTARGGPTASWTSRTSPSVIPREDDGSLWLVEQYRYPVGRRAWEFPQGSWGHGTTRFAV